MSLTPCKGCGNPVDSMAKTCPKCGRSNPVVGNGLRAVLIIVVLAVVGIVAYQCSSGVDAVREDLRNSQR